MLPWIQVAGLAVNLPDNVHLLTVELLADKSVLIRVEQMFATKEDVNLSIPVTVNVKVGSYKNHMQSLWAYGACKCLDTVQWKTLVSENSKLNCIWQKKQKKTKQHNFE